jgi:hypothetical protein
MVIHSAVPHAARLMVLMIAFAALASCGGGGGSGAAPAGGGGAPVPPIPTAFLALNPANAQDVAAGATLTGLGASSAGNLFQAALRMQPPLSRTHILTRFIREQIGRLTQHLQSRPAVLIGAAAVTTPCMVSGSVSVDQGPTSATETFSACSDTAGSSVDGTVTIDNMSLDPGVSFSGLAGLNLTFQDAGFPNVNITGSNVSIVETVNVAVDTVTLSGQEIFTTTGTVSERLGNFTLVASLDASSETDDITFNYASTKIGGSVNVSTVTPCVTDSARQFPNTGVLSLSGNAGSRIQVTINGDETLATPQVMIDLDADGNGAFETTLEKNWTDLAV